MRIRRSDGGKSGELRFSPVKIGIKNVTSLCHSKRFAPELSAGMPRRGYVPRNVQLRYDLTDGVWSSRARATMQDFHHPWLGDPEGEKKPVYDGTIAALIHCYQTDRNSPYRALGQSTGRVYDDWCRTLERAIGKRRVDRLSGQDIRDCFLSLMEPAAPGGAPRVRLAKSCVRSMLSILLNYGAELGLPGCIELAQMLERMIFRLLLAGLPGAHYLILQRSVRNRN